MAKRGKVSTRHEAKPVERPIRSRKYKYRILIVCEGENTEPSYFRYFKDKAPDEIYLKEIGTGSNTVGVVEKAITKRAELETDGHVEFDSTWAVFDRDDHHEDRWNAAFPLAEKGKVKVAFTNESFELWLLLHFQDVEPQKPIGRRELDALLGPHLPDGVYKHGADVSGIAATGDIHTAIARAQPLRAAHKNPKEYTSNPCTTVDRLVAEIEDKITWYTGK